MWDEEVKINLKEKTLFFLALPCPDRVMAVPGINFLFLLDAYLAHLYPNLICTRIRIRYVLGKGTFPFLPCLCNLMHYI